MFVRVEVAVRSEWIDPKAQSWLRRLELSHPDLRRQIRWARMLDVFWIDLDVPRSQMIPALREIFWDPVQNWIFTGDLVPSAAGERGGAVDVFESAPHRNGRFWGIERRYRPGVTDNVARTVLEAFEIFLGKTAAPARVASGSLLMLEGPPLAEQALEVLARESFCNELIESWTLIPDQELRKSERFHPDQVRLEFPRMHLRPVTAPETFDLMPLSEKQLQDLSASRFWALDISEMRTIRDYFIMESERGTRREQGLCLPTDVELEILAQTWSEHCKHKIFAAEVHYNDESPQASRKPIPARIEGLFAHTIAGVTAQIQRSWLLSVFKDNGGILAFDEEDAICIKAETHNSPSALDPYGGALTGIVGVNRDILGCGRGAKPIFNTDVFCLAAPDYAQILPDRILHPRRILEGVRRGVEHGGNKSGVPTINGALVFDDRYLGKPLVYCGTGGMMPRLSAGVPCERKEIYPGDRVIMVGGRIGKDGIHGATFSSLALDERSPSSAVQLGDPITQKRMADFLLEARDLGLYRTLTDNGAGGLSSSVGELARLCGGAEIDVSLAKTKYPGLKPYELVVSESQERMTCAVPPERLQEFLSLAARRAVEVSDLGEFKNSGFFHVKYQGKSVAFLDLDFLHNGNPRLTLQARWKGAPAVASNPSSTFADEVNERWLELLSRPNIASKEWLIRQYDHEVQGMSVIKPLHLQSVGAASGPNDGAVLKPKSNSWAGIAVACGIQPKYSDLDPYIMAQASVDEAIRNILCVGAEYGHADSVLALMDNFCWPDPVKDPDKMGALVRACYGMREAALALGVPLVSGKDSMKNDYRGRKAGEPIEISVPPTLLMTAVGKLTDVRSARSSDFKAEGDAIYVLGGMHLGLQGSELHQLFSARIRDRGGDVRQVVLPGSARLPEPDWSLARRLYSWLGGNNGKKHTALRSAHDLSEGGLLVALAESCIARGWGAEVTLPPDRELWEFAFGEGFHSFLVSVEEAETQAIEAEWVARDLPFVRLGTVRGQGEIRLTFSEGGARKTTEIRTQKLARAWNREGYWE